MVMFHCIACNQAACPTQPCLTMNSHSSRFFLHDFKELLYNGKTWSSSVGEEEVTMLDAIVGESFCIIGFVVESDDHGDS